MRIELNLIAMQGIFFRRLQHQLDVTKVLQVGCDVVTAEQVQAVRDFGSFVPANGAQLSHEKAKEEAHDWLLRGFLRDAIEGTGLFLDDCLMVCALMTLAQKGRARADKVDQVLHELPRANHRLHLPQKLEKLKREFGVDSRFTPHVLSLNKARTCVVHRLSLVSPMDVDNTGALKLIFQHVKLIARGQESGVEVHLNSPGIVLAEESMASLHFVDTERSFAVGNRIQLQASDLYDTIITLWRFGLTIGQSVEAYGKSLGFIFSCAASEP